MLTVVEGKQSKYYNHFADCNFVSCECTDTRLMGVLAMRIKWKLRDNPQAEYYQVLHLDYSEYGIDDYFEFECIPGDDAFQENKDAVNYHWNSFTSVMGGKVVLLETAAMLSLIDEAIPIAESTQHREFDNEENIEFRKEALVRIRLMKGAIANKHTVCTNDNTADQHDYNTASRHNEAIDYNQVMKQVVPKRLTTCETINYFIMRLVDNDFKAAAYLSTISEEELRDSVLAKPGIQTLMLNNIKKCEDAEDRVGDDDLCPYSCRLMTLAERGYYYYSIIIYLDGDYTKRDSKVTKISVGSYERLSEYEAALQHSQREYISVYDCRDRILDGFDGDKFSFLEGIDPQQMPNGWLWTVYNKDNSHVNSANYRISDDVYGYALLSIDGEFVLMSNRIMNISNMDRDTLSSMYRHYMTLSGRYQLDTPIFHTLCNTYGVMFRALIDRPEYSE